MPFDHLILCRPLLLLPPIFPSIRVFSNESVLCIRWPKYCCFSFGISPSSEYSAVWILDLLAVQGTVKSLFQHHSSKALILWCSASFMVQLSHPYMTTGKTIALTSSHVWMWKLNYKESWGPNNWFFWTVVLEKTLESPLDWRRSNQSILKEICPEYPLEGLMLKLKLWPPDAKSWIIGKDPDAGKDWRQEEEGTTEVEMVGQHHWFNVHEFE